MNDKPMTRPWSELREFYEDPPTSDGRLLGMRKLVEQIEGSATLSRLHAWQSMYNLVITQAPVEYPYDGPRLVISQNFDGTIDFRHIDTSIEKKR